LRHVDLSEDICCFSLSSVSTLVSLTVVVDGFRFSGIYNLEKESCDPEARVL
jgi:hypothetical protein